MTESTVSGLIIRLLIPVLGCLSAVSCSPLAAGPAKKIAVSGDTVDITCRSQPTVSYADWARVLSGHVTENEICLNGNCVNGYRRRFSVDVTDNFRLTVLNISTKDSGKYTCIVIDDSEIRYATILDVTDRVTDSAHKATVVAISVEPTSTTVIQHVTDVGYTVTIVAIVIVIFLVMTAAIVVSVYVLTRRKGRRDCLCFAKPATETDTSNGEDNCGKLLDVDMDERQKKKGANEQIEETTTPQVHGIPITSPASKKDADELLSVMMFLKIVRAIDTGNSNVSSASSASFKLVAYAYTIWWNKLMNTNAKHQIRRLLYYYRSGYGRYATYLKQLPPTASDDVPVTGVAALNGDVYLIHKDSNTVQFLQSNQTKQIIVPDMKCPVDIVACTSVHGLYIADEQGRCVWLAEINHNPVKCVKCVTFAERAPIALSLRRDSLLVTTNTQIIAKHSKGDGTFMEIILRTESPVEPQHAVETSLSTLLVAFKEGRGYNLAEFDFNGQQLRKFVCVAGLLRFPSYLVLDSSERLLIADFDNNRILLADAKLEPIRACAILSQQRDGIVAPQRFCSDHVTGELFVVQTTINSLDVTTYVVKKYANASTTSMPKRRPTSQNYHTA